jgi:hypothetical protein
MEIELVIGRVPPSLLIGRLGVPSLNRHPDVVAA